MRRGLVFGKFMPLHRGHQLLIEAALAECDAVTVAVYDSRPAGSYEPMPVEKRLEWVAALYPQAEQVVAIPDLWYDEPGHDDHAYAERYARQLDFLGRFDRVFTSEPGYEDFVRHLGAEHRLLDEARELVPISGTRIRADLYAHRGWMDPLVYSSLVRRVALVGTESTGKTTLAREMAARMRTRWTHEYGRELWVAQGGGGFVDHLPMALRQRERELAALRHSRRFLFCDTNAWTTLMWSRFMYGAADARLERLADESMGDYTWFVCDTDIPFEDDGIRELVGGVAADFHAFQLDDLRRRGVEFEVLSGGLEARAHAVEGRLARATSAAAA